jgi:Spy/CpxP family protein refolding chaperone
MKKMFGIAVLTCGFLLLAVSASALQQAPQNAPDQRTRHADRMGTWLGLTPDQQAKLDALRKGEMERRQAGREEMRKLGDELRTLRNDPQADPKKADALIDRLTRLRGEEMKADFRQHQEFLKILTPEQREKLAQFRGRMARRMMSPFPHRGRRPGRVGMLRPWSWRFGGSPFYWGARRAF